MNHKAVRAMSADAYEAAWMAPMTEPQRALFLAEMRQARRDPRVGVLLALLVGGFGVHRFYLGDLLGIVYLIFCWTFIPMIVSAIEALIFMRSRVEAYNKQQAYLIAVRIQAYAAIAAPARVS